MLLYHGTSAAAVSSILENGIQPRQVSGIAPTQKNYCKLGHPECVYMSNGYASFFAAQAVDSASNLAEAAILEIDTNFLDKRLLLPDEDVITQQLANDPKNEWYFFDQLITKARNIMTDLNSEWKKSVLLIGNCAYRGIIPPHAIKRVSYIDFNRMGSRYIEIVDITVSMLAYRVSSKKYKMIDSWFFGGKVKSEFRMMSTDLLPEFAEYCRAYEKEWSDRSMVRVENFPGYKKKGYQNSASIDDELTLR